MTIKPGAYPWGNHPNAWRPAHIHFSLFGRAFSQRLVTQMYFPGDPLFPYDPIFGSVRDPRDSERLIAHVRPGDDSGRLGARLPLRHRPAGGRSDSAGELKWSSAPLRRRQSGRFCTSVSSGDSGPSSCRRTRRARSGSTGRVIDGAGDPVPDALVEVWQASSGGRYDEGGFTGFGRSETRTAAGSSSSPSSRARRSAGGRPPGAAPERRCLRPRPPETALHQDVFPGRGGRK